MTTDKIDTTKFAGHSPGPWYLMDKNRTIQVSSSVDHDNPSAIVHWTGFDSGDKPLPVKRANARLIAAAPDLLAAYTELSRENADLREKVEGARQWAMDHLRAEIEESTRQDAERDTLRTQVAALQGEVERLGRAAQWYGEEARAINRYMTQDPPKPDACLGSLTVLSLDGGRRAAEAIAYTSQPLAPTDPNHVEDA